MDFVLYLQALNRHLISRGHHDADDRRAREYFDENLPIEQATSLEAVEQDLDSMSDPSSK